MKRTKPVFMITVMLMGILSQFMTTVGTIQAFADTGQSILDKSNANLLPTDKHGNKTIFTDVKMMIQSKNNPNEEEEITESRPLEVGDYFTIHYTFEIPDVLGKEIESGDYFEFDLPKSEDIQLTRDQDGDLIDLDDDTVYGKYYASKDGHVVMTFNENVKTHDDVDGRLSFTVRFEERTIHIPGGYEIDFPYVVDGGGSTLYVKGKHDSYIQKEYKGTEGLTYKWKVLINPTYQKMNNLRLTESTVAQDGKGTKAKSINIDKMLKADVKLNGDIEEKEEVSLKNNTFDDNGEIDLGFDSIAEPYVLYLSTPFDLGINETVENTIWLSADINDKEEYMSASATANKGALQLIDKKPESYDRDKQEVSWLVTYNPGSFYIKEEDANFRDEITNGTYIEGSMTVDPDLPYSIDVADDKQSFDFQFHTDVNQPVDIRYKTKVINPDAPGRVVKNKVIAKEQEKEVSQPVIPGGGGEGEGGDGTSSIEKSVRPGGDDFSANWTLDINDEHKMLDKWWVTDNLDSGYIRQNTLKVKDVTAGKELRPGSDYQLEWHKNSQNEATGFTVTYDKPTSNKFKIEYQTSMAVGKDQTNHAIYHYTVNGNDKEDEDSKTRPAVKVGEIGLSKSGKYIPDLRQIEWTVIINDGTKVPVTTNNLFRDPILEDQTYVENSATYSFLDGSVWQTHYKPEITFNDTENQLEVRKLKETTNQQRIVFRTELKNNMEILTKTIYNTAYFSDDYTKEKDANASLTINNSNDYVLKKQGKQNVQNDKLIDWTVDVNPYNYKLDNLVIYDESWVNQRVIKDSIELRDALTGTKLLEGENADYQLEFTERYFKIIMNHRVESHLILSYQGLLVFPEGTPLGSNQEVKNSVRITADRVIKTGKPIDKTVNVKVSDSSGVVQGKVRDLNVIKVSEEDGTTTLPEAEFTLYRGTEKDANKIVDKQMTNQEGEALFTRLTKGDYLLVETKAPEGYDISSEMKSGRIFTITTDETSTIEEVVENPKTGSEKFIEIPVEKKWEKPSYITETPEVTVQLLANGYPKGTLKLNEENGYKGTFRNLPEKENGYAIDYTIEEVAIDDYESSVSGSTQNGYVITNTYESETTHFTGKKQWKNDVSSDRPDKIEIQLLQDGDNYRDPITVSKSDDWEYKFDELPKVNETTGVDYEYSVKEINPPAGYNSEVIGKDIVNTKEEKPIDPEKINIKVQKKWQGDNASSRPRSVRIDLYQGRKNIDHVVLEPEDEVAPNIWEYEFKGLDKTDSAGDDYVYTVVEEEVPNGYEVSYEETSSGWIVVNKAKPKELTSFSGKKEWKNDTPSDRPESITVELLQNNKPTGNKKNVTSQDHWTYEFKDLDKKDSMDVDYKYSVKEINPPDGYTSEVKGNNIINTKDDKPEEPELIEVPVVKIWNDNQNALHMRPDFIYFFLYRIDNDKPNDLDNLIFVDEADLTGDTNADTWEYVFTDLPKKDEKNRENHYIVKEVSMSDNLYSQKTEGTTVTNTLSKQTTEVKGEKKWKQDTPSDRPDEITVELFGKDKDRPLKSTTTTAKDNWKYEFKELDMFDTSNQKINYTVKEVPVDGYTSKVEGTTITNTKKEPEKTSIRGKKIWENDTEAIRPEEIEVSLLRNKEPIRTIPVKPDSKGNWEYEFKDLPVKDADDNDYLYEVKEKTVIPGYESSIDGYDITNTYDSSLFVTVKGEKHWKDQTESTRPDAIYVILEQAIKEDGKDEALLDWQPFGDKKEVTKTQNWKYEFKELPAQDKDGNSYVYRVIEDRDSISWKADYETTSVGYDLYNVLKTGKINLEGKKTWVEPNGNSKFRPESIKVHLYQNGVELKDKEQIVKSDKNNPVWTYTFKDLEKTNPETMIDYTYTVKEDPIPNYDTSYSGMNITNTLNQKETVDIKGEKLWDDEGFETKRPNKVTIELYRKINTKPETKVTSIETDKNKNWKYEFVNQPKYDPITLEEYTYSVKEVPVPGYTSEVLGYDVSNKYINDSKISIDGKKIWEDNNYKWRPKSVKVVLYQEGANQKIKEWATKEISGETDTWEYKFDNLPEFDDKGNAYVYTVKEVDVPPGYTSKVDGTTITNTYSNDEMIEISGEKIWNDYNNHFKTRPETIKVKLSQNGQPYREQDVSEGADGKWTYAFKKLPRFDASHIEYKYTVEEVPVDKYQTKVNGHIIENTYVNDKTIKFSGKKKWNDYNNQFTTRPRNVTIYLLDGNEKIAETVAEADKNWEYSFTNKGKGYPVYDEDGQVIPYRILEKDVQGYTTTITEPTESIEEVDEIKDYDITNTYVNTEKTSLSGSKSWDDFDNKHTSRPSKITVTLYSGGEPTKLTQELSESNDWEYHFNDLPVYDKDGKVIEYSVKEEVVPGYEQVQGGPNFVNKWEHKDGKTFIEGEKIWKDENNQLGKRPNEVTIILYQNNVPMLDHNGQIMTQEISISNFWKYRFDDLPKYDETGNEYVYTVKEETVPGYTTEVVGKDVINTYKNTNKTLISGKKVWDDKGNKLESRPESITVELYQNEGKQPYKTKIVQPDIKGNWKYTFVNLPKYDDQLNEYRYTVKEVNVPHYESSVNGTNIENKYINDEVTELKGKKEWADQNNILGTRPGSIEIELYQNEGSNPFKIQEFEPDANGKWSYEFTNLPKYDDNLEEYRYTVKEVPVTDYDSEVYPDNTIVNTYQNKNTVDVQGDKIWNDHQNILHSRPEQIVVNLHRNNKPIPVKYQKVMADTDGQWHYEFTDLPKYDKNLNEYDYRVKELKVPRYSSQVEVDPITGNMNIINTYDNTDLTEIKGQKLWENDVDNKLNTRPESIKIDLYQIDPSDTNRKEVFMKTETVKPDGNGDWFYEFTDLPKLNDDLLAYEYIVKEQPIKNYDSTVDDLNITNKYKNNTTIDLSGTKVWNDENNILETRPNELFIELYQTTKGQPEVGEGQSPYRITKVQANQDDNWFYEFTDLPKYDDNLDEYIYTIREQDVVDYDNKIDGLNVENKYKNEEKTKVTGQKHWDDKDDKLNVRPQSIKVNLYRNNRLMIGKTQTVTPDEKGDWKYEFTDLPKYDNELNLYQYTVKEQRVPHYTSTVNGTDITNTYENTDLTKVVGQKIWEDENNKLKLRPESIVVELYQNDQLMVDKTQTVKPNKLGHWKYEFVDLPKYDDNLELYKYTVKEQSVPNYSTTIVDSNITNTYINNQLTSVKGEKIWVDHDNKLKTRPKQIKVELYQNDILMEELTQTVKPTKDGDWSYEFKDLPKYDASLDEYRYSVKEQIVDGYTSEVNGFDITNTYQNKELVKRHVKKKWDDQDNKIKSRPEKIKVNLYQNDGKKPYKSKVIKPDEKGNWEYTFEDLPKYDDNYDEYVYIAVEEVVDHYKGNVEVSDGNIIITNTYQNTDLTSIRGEKQWNDLDNKLNKRPEKITVDLYQNDGKEPMKTQEVKPDKEGNWFYEFNDLPKYDKELNEYQYTVKEHNVNEYTTYIEDTTIVNTYKNVETTELKGEKQWNDFDNKLESRPESIKVDLYQNGGEKPFRTQEVKPDKKGNWKYNFKELPKHDKDLNEYTYTVKEQPVSHYESQVEGTTITNTYQNTDVTEIQGEKTWSDEDNKLGKRPNFILVELYQLAPGDNTIQEGQKPFKIRKVEPNESGAWKYEFKDLPKYDDKLEEFNYVVKEHEVVDYQAEVKENNIHNTYQNTELTEVKGEKIWVDEDNKYQTRPKSIQIELYQNGKLLKDQTQKIKADEVGDWSYEFKDLPKYDDKLVEYTYTVKEVPVKGYTSKVQGTTITNTLDKRPTDPDKPEPGKPGPNTPGNPSNPAGKGAFLPKTGEDMTDQVITSLIGLTLISLIGFLGYRRREQ